MRKKIVTSWTLLLLVVLALVRVHSVFADLTNGLVAHWQFDENGGTTAIDSAGTNDGAIQGGAAYTTDGIAPVSGNVSALTFDGVNDAVEVPHADALDMTAAYSISTWVIIENISGYQSILCRGATATDIELYWYPGGQGLTVVHNRGNGGPFDFIYFVHPPIGTLFHLAVVFDGTVVKAFYDGLPATPQFDPTLSAPSNTNQGWKIGKIPTVAVLPFKGLLDEVRVYNRVLSESEIAELANLPTFTQCLVDLSQCGADLSACTDSLSATNAALSQCNTTLATTQAALAAAIADADQDGLPNLYDHCPGTESEAEIDAGGCSLAQFCHAIAATTPRGARSCKKSDWRNDEPVMTPQEADCTVDKGGPGSADDQCVPHA